MFLGLLVHRIAICYLGQLYNFDWKESIANWNVKPELQFLVSTWKHKKKVLVKWESIWHIHIHNGNNTTMELQVYEIFPVVQETTIDMR